MQIIKYLINILGSGILSWAIWYSYKLWVLPPIGNSKNESIELLKSQILEIGIEKLSWAIGAILILIPITWAIQKYIEKMENRKEIFFLLGLNLFIVSIGLIIGVFDAFNGLSVEIERNF